MKLSQFKQIIREEVKKVLRENTTTEVTVNPRHAKAAQDIFKSDFRSVGKMEYTNVFSFNNEEDLEDFVQALVDSGIPNNEIQSSLNEAMNQSVVRDIEKKLNIKLDLFGSGGSGSKRDSVFQVRDLKNPKLSKGLVTLQLMITPDNLFYFTYGSGNSIRTSVNPLRGKVATPAPLDQLTPEVYQEAVNYVNSQK